MKQDKLERRKEKYERRLRELEGRLTRAIDYRAKAERAEQDALADYRNGRISYEDYEKAKGKYVISMDNLPLLKESARILHPLPKIDEINLPIDVEENDKRIAYFRQAENGLYIRMALLVHILS